MCSRNLFQDLRCACGRGFRGLLPWPSALFRELQSSALTGECSHAAHEPCRQGAPTHGTGLPHNLALSLAAGLGLAALDLDEQMALAEAGPQALAGAGLDPEEFCALPFELNGSALCAEGRWQLLQHSSG